MLLEDNVIKNPREREKTGGGKLIKSYLKNRSYKFEGKLGCQKKRWDVEHVLEPF